MVIIMINYLSQMTQKIYNENMPGRLPEDLSWFWQHRCPRNFFVSDHPTHSSESCPIVKEFHRSYDSYQGDKKYCEKCWKGMPICGNPDIIE
jgi:hypothetical protein